MGVDIKGMVALVTGANRGIGKAIVESFLTHGAAKVYAAVRKPETAESLVEAHGGKVVPVPYDLARPEQITAAAATAGDVQVVVNNAGVLRIASPLAADAIEALQFQMEVNVHGLIRTAQAFAPVLKTNGGGAFVQLNSIASLKGMPDFSLYCASKAAAYSVTQSLHSVLKEQGTHVLSVHPGPIESDMATSAGLGDLAEPASLVSEGIVEALRAGEYHLFPDTMAKQFGDAYRGFAESIVEAELALA